ncbi:DUF3427 domain-containing protein [Oceanobacter kriegii]|uniref:DUF3427 domain-containing protein n=1 Tax=Oceanobacter kriegii TaxID=64972 RepID=UPI00041D758B|nr:DEAD/DEAH box helicase [Oceanobacter kriegii]
MEQGIYEQLITESLRESLPATGFYAGERDLDKEEAALWLARFLTHLLTIALDELPPAKNPVQAKLEFANQLIGWVAQQVKDPSVVSGNLLDMQGKILTAFLQEQNPVAANLKNHVDRITPLTGLSESELFCGSNAELSLDGEIKREILSADEIYLLVSFIKWTGIRIFKDELEEFTKSGRKLKVITTSYMGATDYKAIQFLSSLPNTEIKLSYNTQRERLHAKSYMFKRKTGFHTGYIGSSNLSHSALTSGLEWNLKITSKEIPHILDKSLNTFEVYWNSKDFEPYDGSEPCQQKLRQALRAERGSSEDNGPDIYFDITPFPHQKEILEKLDVERVVHSRKRNLVVAATGTGKTLISAFDFARYVKQHPAAKFLFVAHRQEILKQALASYRAVLRDRKWGDLWHSGQTPESYEQLFVMVQTLNNALANEQLNLSTDYYDFIVIDEVHHVAASSYRKILEHFSPDILLGLTATPERQDGENILADFDHRVAAEIRLPEAVNQRLLSPFHYFMIHDDVSLTAVPWKQGKYEQAELSRLYREHPERIQKIIATMEELLTDLSSFKALAFCVDQSHAEFTTEQFKQRGFKAAVLTSANSSDRDQLRAELRSGAINILCVVDMFNEGVDIPEVDTLLFLRPTESLTVFLQQLGRGLRLKEGKDSCTVLDFVGQSRAEYDFASRLRALVGKTQTSIKSEVEDGFPHLPAGCQLQIDKQTQEQVLKNISAAVLNLNGLRKLIRNFPHQTNLEPTLENFLTINPQVQLEDIYRLKVGNLRGWSALVESALNEVNEPSASDELVAAYGRAIYSHLMVCTSLDYLQFLQRLCRSNFRMPLETEDEQAYGLMTHYAFWEKSGSEGGFDSLESSLSALANKPLQQELTTVLKHLIEQMDHVEQSPMTAYDAPLKVHSRYTREQILAGFSASTFEKKSTSREGRLAIKDSDVELMFVTLEKSEKHFSPAVMYHDYAVTETLFHWQTQNSARPDKGVGLSYINQKVNGKKCVLFVRERAKGIDGRTMGFVNLGCVNYVAHTGSQPMNITWELEQPMPAFMWKAAAKLSQG